MPGRISRHVRSNIVGYVALFVAMSGVAYAADGPLAGQNTVGSEDIINGEVKNADLGGNSVATGKITDGQVTNADLGTDAVTTGKIADGTIGGADLGTGSVSGGFGGELASSTITRGNMAQNSVANPEIVDDAIQPDDIFEVEVMEGSTLLEVNDPEGGGSTNVGLTRTGLVSGSIGLAGRCTDAGGGVVTAKITANTDAGAHYAATSNAPGATTAPDALGVTQGGTQLASFGPTTAAKFGSGSYFIARSGIAERPLIGVLGLGTHVLGSDCVFAANALA